MADKRISQLIERTDIANNDVLPIVASGANTTNKVTVSTLQDWMQDNLDVGVTSVGITIGTTGSDINVSGSPVTSSGNITINIPTASATNRGLLSAADWSTFNAKQPAGNYVTLDTTQTITAHKTFTASGGQPSITINHSSGAGHALDITKAGNGEGIRVNKTSGSGNAVSVVGTLEATTLVRTGGTSSQFLKADGSVDSSTYVTTDTNQSITGFKSFTNGFSLASAGGTNQPSTFKNIGTIHEGSANSNQIGFNNSNNIYFGKGLNNGGVISWNNAAVRSYTLPDADGTIALTSNLSSYLPLAGGTLTGALNGTSAVFSGDVQSGTRLIAAASSQSIILTPNSGGTTNRVESVGTLPLALVSAAAITMAAGGTTPQITLATTGAVTLTGALNGTSASFSGLLTAIPTATTLVRAATFGNTSTNALSAASIGFNLGGGDFGAIEVGYNSNSPYMDLKVGASLTQSLRLASTGAATFSSSVTATGSGSSSGLIINNASGSPQNYIDFTAGATVLGRISRGNGASGLETNGLNIDNFSGFKVRLNQLGGSGGSFTIDGGNVGIGTASPSSRLHIGGVGSALAFDTTGIPNSIKIRTVEDFKLSLFCERGTTSEIKVGNDNLEFLTYNTERMRITSGGILMVGTSTVLGGGGSESVNGLNIGGSGVIVNNSYDDYNAYFAKRSGYTSNGILAFYVAGSLRGSITTNGTSVSYNTTSDYRLKEDFQEINGLEKISALKVYNYQWKDSEERTDGVLAHELKEVLPYAVNGEKDAVDEEGKEIMQGVDYSKIVPVLIKAIQELKAEIDSLKTK